MMCNLDIVEVFTELPFSTRFRCRSVCMRKAGIFLFLSNPHVQMEFVKNLIKNKIAETLFQLPSCKNIIPNF
jgi:hydroxypyruvate isomerase